MRNLKQHISGEHPQRKFWEQSGQKILCPDKGTRRKYAELKTAYFRRVPQRKFWEQSGQKFLCQVRVLGGNMRNLNIEGRGQNGRK